MTPAQYKAERIRLNLTQAKLAKVLQIARETVARREAGQVQITEEMRRAILSLRRD